jgi:hypothetical protein
LLASFVFYSNRWETEDEPNKKSQVINTHI